jgi:uncharacterized protein involved in type VI secretion and phage assembly
MMHDRMQGIVIAKVTEVVDPERQGRVQVQFPWLDENLQSIWASIVAPFAGDDRGMFFMPEVGDEVVVASCMATSPTPMCWARCGTG